MDDASDELLAMGCAVVVVKLGEHGLRARVRERSFSSYRHDASFFFFVIFWCILCAGNVRCIEAVSRGDGGGKP